MTKSRETSRIHQIRYDNMRKFMALKNWKMNDLAVASKRPYSMLAMYLNDKPQRQMGNLITRKLEKELDFPEFILDQEDFINQLKSSQTKIEGELVREKRAEYIRLGQELEQLERNYLESLYHILSDTLFSFSYINEYEGDGIYTTQINNQEYKAKAIIAEYKKPTKVRVPVDVNAFFVVIIDEKDNVSNIRFSPRYEEPLLLEKPDCDVNIFAYWRSNKEDAIIQTTHIENNLGINISDLDEFNKKAS